MASAGLTNFETKYALTPIILTGGIASSGSGGLPISTLTGGLSPPFAHYYPLQGGTLIQNQVATYPFANQAIAANAIIVQPNTISLMMVCPAKEGWAWSSKTPVMTGLQNSLSVHINKGGLFSVATPSYIYVGCILMSLRDISSDPRQPQSEWQWEFFQPLTSQSQAQQALNSLTQKIANGTPPAGSPTNAPGLPVNNPTNAVTLGQSPSPIPSS